MVDFKECGDDPKSLTSPLKVIGDRITILECMVYFIMVWITGAGEQVQIQDGLDNNEGQEDVPGLDHQRGVLVEQDHHQHLQDKHTGANYKVQDTIGIAQHN